MRIRSKPRETARADRAKCCEPIRYATHAHSIDFGSTRWQSRRCKGARQCAGPRCTSLDRAHVRTDRKRSLGRGIHSRAQFAGYRLVVTTQTDCTDTVSFIETNDRYGLQAVGRVIGWRQAATDPSCVKSPPKEIRWEGSSKFESNRQHKWNVRSTTSVNVIGLCCAVPYHHKYLEFLHSLDPMRTFKLGLQMYQMADTYSSGVRIRS